MTDTNIDSGTTGVANGKLPETDSSASQILESSQKLGQMLQVRGVFMTTAESCTGGLIAGAITEVPGSSGWFAQGVITYSNTAKQQLLGVPEEVFEQHGAVSEFCVRAMAQGAQRASGASVAVAVSGVAGPDGGSKDKPVGTVWLAWAIGSAVSAELFTFNGNRSAVRQQAVLSALRGTISRIRQIEIPTS